MASKAPQQLESTKRFIRNFLRINNSREFLVFLFFLLVAFFFWYLTTMSNEYDMTYTPKVTLKNVPNKMIVTSPLPKSIEVTLKDKGDKLIEFKVRGKLKEIDVDYRQFTPNKMGHAAIYGAELHRLISAQLPPSTQIVAISHDTLQYYVAAAQGVKVPVRINGRIEADNQHEIERISLIPDRITVYAPSVYLDTLTAVYTPKIQHVGISDSISQIIELTPKHKSILYDPSEVMLHVAVSPYVTKSLEVPITGYLFPYEISLKTFPSKARVSFRVSLEDFDKITEKDLTLQVHYTQIQDNRSGKVALHIANPPANIANIKIEPSEVDYLLEVNALRSEL